MLESTGVGDSKDMLEGGSAEIGSVCAYCGVGCGVLVRTRGDRVVGVRGDPDHPANRGDLCSKGRELHETVHLPNRLLHPLVRDRKYGERRRASWEEATGRIARALGRTLDEKDPDWIGLYLSGQLLTEDYYVFNKLAKGFLGTPNVDSNSRLCMSAATVAYKDAFGVDGPPTCYEDIDLADLFFVVGSNAAWCHPVLFRRMERAREARRVPLIVVDPRRTATAEVADLHVPIRPGTDGILLTGLLAELARRGALDEAFIARRTSGFDAVRGALAAYPRAYVARNCGISEDLLARVADAWCASRAALSFWAMGVNQKITGSNTSSMLINLHLATGQVGRPGAGPFSLTGQPNAMGGREVGGLANLLPAHRDYFDPADRAEVQALWRSGPLPDWKGLTAVEMFERAADGRLDVLWIACTNPAVSIPDQAMVREAFARTPLVILQDVFATTATAAQADILLPAAGWAEKSGTVTNSERRVSAVRQAIPAPGECLPDWQIACDVARRMGHGKAFAFKTAEDVWREHLRTTRGRDCEMTGMTRERLERGPLQWPCRDADDPGAARLYADGRFATPDGRARFVPPGAFVLAEEPSDAYPLRMISGRLRDQWHTMTKTGRVPELRQHAPEARAEIAEADADRLGIATGDRIEIASRRGAFRIGVERVDTLAPGTLFVPIHPNEEFAPNLVMNRATTPERDPRCGQPELKHAAVRVRRLVPEGTGRVVIVGMGAAGIAVARRLRALQPERPIALVGKEPRLHYDRVRLHEIVAGAAQPAALETHGADWYAAQGFELYVGAEAVAVDPRSRAVHLADGRAIPYERLVLAHGAGASAPGVPGADLDGVFTIRGLDEALALRAALAAGGPAVVVGAGPLGVEVAAALGAAGAEVSLVTHGDRPLRRAIDAEAASILVEALRDVGVRVVRDARVEAVEGNGRVEAVRLADGRALPACAAVFAIGVAFDPRLAATAGLRLGERVRVDVQLRTSDPAIFAVGDAAEFEDAPTGLVSVAEAHGDVVARVLAGDDGAAYRPEPPITNLKLPNLEVRASGRVHASASDEEDELIYLDRRRRRYRKIVLVRDRIAGVVSVGPFSGFVELHRRMRSALRVGDARDGLLSGIWEADGSREAGPTICACMSVRAGALIAAIASGARSVEELGAATAAGRGCGSCRPELAALIRRMGAGGPSPPPG